MKNLKIPTEYFLKPFRNERMKNGLNISITKSTNVKKTMVIIIDESIYTNGRSLQGDDN